MNKYSRDVSILIFIFICILIYPFLFTAFMKEGFNNNLSPNHYTENTKNGALLGDSFELIENPHLGNQNVSAYIPQANVSSYKQEIHNKRNIPSPDEGTCTGPEFCNVFYKIKQVNKKKLPPVIPFSNPLTRINFFNTCKSVN